MKPGDRVRVPYAPNVSITATVIEVTGRGAWVDSDGEESWFPLEMIEVVDDG